MFVMISFTLGLSLYVKTLVREVFFQRNDVIGYVRLARQGDETAFLPAVTIFLLVRLSFDFVYYHLCQQIVLKYAFHIASEGSTESRLQKN